MRYLLSFNKISILIVATFPIKNQYNGLNKSCSMLRSYILVMKRNFGSRKHLGLGRFLLVLIMTAAIFIDIPLFLIIYLILWKVYKGK